MSSIKTFCTALYLAFFQAKQNLGDIIVSCGFYVLIVMVFGFLSPLAQQDLSVLAPCIIWLGAYIAILLSVAHLYSQDFQDGYYLQLFSRARSPMIFISTKLLAQLLFYLLPTLAITALLGLFLHQSSGSIVVLLATMALGLPVVFAFAALGAALMVALDQKALLLLVLMIPLLLPVLLLAVGCAIAYGQGLNILPLMALLGALFLFCGLCIPFLIAVLLRANLS
mgnify:CR=1 FL=1